MKTQTLFGVLALVGATALTSGCAARASVGGSASAESEPPVVFTGTPTLIALDGNIWVVRDADRATYYDNDSYWVVRDGTWYKSRTFDGGWAKVEASEVPGTISSRTHTTYVNYKGDATAQTKPAPRAGDAITSANVGSPSSKSGPPGHDDIPGVGNQRKADGDQPGNSPHSSSTGGAVAASDAPGVGNDRKADGLQPGQVGNGPSKATPGAADSKKPDAKKPDAKKPEAKPDAKKDDVKKPEKKDDAKKDAKKDDKKK